MAQGRSNSPSLSATDDIAVPGSNAGERVGEELARDDAAIDGLFVRSSANVGLDQGACGVEAANGEGIGREGIGKQGVGKELATPVRSHEFGLLSAEPVARLPVPTSRAAQALAAALAVAGLLIVVTAQSFLIRTLLPLGLSLIAIAVWQRMERRGKRRADAQRLVGRQSRRRLRLDPLALGLYDHPDDDHPEGGASPAVGRGAGDAPTTGPRLLHSIGLDSRFGVTLFSSRDRRRVLAVISSRGSTFLFGCCDSRGADGSPGAASALAPYLNECVLFSGEETALEATAPDGQDVRLSATEFVQLLQALDQLRPGCLGRLELTDQRGESIALDQEALVVRHARFDLARPLEWRAVLFQETFGQAITICQATWLRQGNSEVVFVSLLPPQGFDILTPVPRSGDGNLDHLALRDQRLMQASAGEPPPADQRIALDGLFMLPLRVALDDAPRASSQPGANATPS